MKRIIRFFKSIFKKKSKEIGFTDEMLIAAKNVLDENKEKFSNRETYLAIKSYINL
jgi:hypothetical protein